MVRLNRKLGGWLVWAAGCLLPAAQGSAQAEGDRVVLLEDPALPPRPVLGQALRIQLFDRARVDVVQGPAASGLSERVAAASALAQDALVVVWAEPTVTLGDGSREAVLYVVGHKQGRALVEIVRVQGGDSPDVDRSLALKVREVVDEVRKNRERGAETGLLLEPLQEPPLPLVPPGGGWGATVGVGGAVGPLSGFGQFGAQLYGGPAYAEARMRLTALLALTWYPELESSQGAATVRLREVGPGLLARAQVRADRAWLGLRAGLTLSFVDAEATSALGRGGDDVRFVSWLSGVDVELPITRAVALSVALDLQTRFHRQRFAVSGREVVDFGRVRPLLLLSLSWNSEAVR
jgi:hypothetical protein